jgi:hypothetical protein
MKKPLLALLAAAALALTACGGGVEVVVGDDDDPPPVRHVSDTFALRTAASSLTGGPVTLLAPSGSMLAALSALLPPNNGYKTQSLDISSVCATSGGRLIFAMTDAGNDGRFTPGDAASFTFTNCTLAADGLAIFLNGTLNMGVSVTQRGPDTVSTFWFTPQNLSGLLGAVAATYGGSVGVEYVFPNGNLNADAYVSYVSSRLELLFAGTRRDVISNMVWPVSFGPEADRTNLQPSHTISLSEAGIADTFTVGTLRSVEFRGDPTNLFTSGETRHLDDVDAVYATVTGTDQLRVEIDYSSNGSINRTINIPVRTLINSWN